MTKKEFTAEQQAERFTKTELIRIQKLLTKEMNFLESKRKGYEEGIVLNSIKNELQEEARERIFQLNEDISSVEKIRAKIKILIAFSK